MTMRIYLPFYLFVAIAIIGTDTYRTIHATLSNRYSFVHDLPKGNEQWQTSFFY